ncbi:Nuclear/nucleolar GTPase 2 [Melia azedarach]|uniref:Nuclear/nucleolar GTPase 2 n=1 Tax=Melia azedarach TaxID=155640 RepID=A0ACC1YSY4_MELAZ|nr:Nuclear/nucleolar GTPase 2 [Melia azedarach]
MAETKEKKVKGKPKHSLDANRTDGKSSSRSSLMVRRLKMYSTRPKRDRKGKILQHEFQTKELPNTRIQPDCRWFDAFGPKGKRKRPKLLAADYESLLKRADGSQDAFEQKHVAGTSAEGGWGDGFRDLV